MIGSLNPALEAPWLGPVGLTSVIIGGVIWMILILTAKKPEAAPPPPSTVNVTSYGQSGGTTAQNVNGEPQNERPE